jgi:hypothetical protein
MMEEFSWFYRHKETLRGYSKVEYLSAAPICVSFSFPGTLVSFPVITFSRQCWMEHFVLL